MKKHRRIFLTATALVSWVLLSPGLLAAETVKTVGERMGSHFEITAWHGSEETARQAVEAAYEEIDRIEAMISSWRSDSVTSAIQRQAGLRPVVVPRELFRLIQRALKVSELTDGAFDITFATVGQLWDFKAENPRVPEAAQIEAALSDTGYRNVALDEDAGTVFLKQRGTRLGFGAIGKGYAANRAVQALKDGGVSGGVVNAGGDLLVFGRQEDGSRWPVSIADPRDRQSTFARLEVEDQAVVTSGDYERFLVIDGTRYSHILDPRTGYPVGEVRSATVICPDAELADALATAVSVLGVKKGLELVDRLRGVEVLLVDDRGRLHSSKSLETMLEKETSKP